MGIARTVLVAASLLGTAITESAGKEKAPPATRHQSLTLESAISLALKQNPDVLKAIHEIERTRGQVIQVSAQALPNVQAAGSYNQYAPELFGGGGGSTSSFSTGSSQDKSWRITLQVQQILYSGGKVKAAVKIAELTQDTSHQLLRETVNTVVANVRTQFYTVLLNR
ncbi:MAG: TolC family protein, partial [Verrucomicrobiota bacterium]